MQKMTNYINIFSPPPEACIGGALAPQRDLSFKKCQVAKSS
jgi:hypothetical protein